MTGMVATLSFDTQRMREAAGTGFVLATDLAELLVSKGVPFREAHERVGKVVGLLEADGRTFDDVGPDEWETLDPGLGADVLEILSPDAAVRRRTTAGGPSSESVRRQVEILRSRLAR